MMPSLRSQCIAAMVVGTLTFNLSHACAQEIIAPAAVRFASPETVAVPDFQRHVVPLLGRNGCNSAKCHGSFQGQGDFRLSLFGFDFAADHAAMHAEAASESGLRLDIQSPEKSLILRKPTEQTDHEGGERFPLGSWEHHLLSRWIETGALGALVKGTDEPSSDTANSSQANLLSKESKDRDEGLQLFQDRIQPLFESHCYECHGYNMPKAGFKLTTRTQILEGGNSGAAIVPHAPDASLLVRAIRYTDEALQMPPSGTLKPQQIADLETWVRLGAPWPDRYAAAAGDTSQVLVRLRYEPEEILFQETNQSTQIRIIAEWENGIREDVTCLSRFQTNNDAVVRVDKDGLATSVGEGDSHIVAFYDNGVAAIPVLRRYANGRQHLQTARTQRSDHPIDRFVTAKLDKLGLVPSGECTDAEFLRRVSIDMTGTLPTPAEITSFLADPSERKRAKKIDELLQRPAYAAWWANKLCDFTGCNPLSIDGLLEVATERGYAGASHWYDWIYERVDRNVPYDELVEGIMLSPLDSSDGSMPYFWRRQSLKEPKDTAMSVAHAFLGIQLQCAECHKHPFDRWTQSDFSQFSQFFDAVTTTKRQATVQEQQNLRLLRSQSVSLASGDDPRVPIMDWMRNPDNPWFAQAFVNRVWASYFNVGIVDPPDQFTPANPPGNPQLLAWLTRGFIENRFDMKWLHRQIANSQTYQRSWKPNATNREDRRNYSRAIPRRIPAEVVYDAMKQATVASDQQESVRTNLQRRASGHLSMRMAGTHAMKVFGKPDRSITCDCERVNEPTLLQAIFVQNDPLVRMRLADSGWIIGIEDAEEAKEVPDAAQHITEAWLRTVGRPPTEDEIQRATRHLNSVPSRATGVSDLLWALLNTKEFLLNH